MVLLFLLAPLLSSPVGLLSGAPSPNSILHAFLGLTGSRLHSTIFLSASSFSSLTSLLTKSFLTFFFTVNLIIRLFFIFQHSLPFSPSPLFLCLLLPDSVFLVLPLICNLWIYPFLLSLYGPSASLRECCLLGLRGVMPGWGISLPYTSVFPFLFHPLTPSLISVALPLPSFFCCLLSFSSSTFSPLST